MQAGADPENFSRGGGVPTLSKIDSVWRITVEVSTNMKNNYFLISSNIGDIKFCKFQGGPDAPDFPPPSRSVPVQVYLSIIILLSK